jgi:acyl carrier protein
MSASDPLASFPPAVREAHARWLDARDLDALDAVVLAIVVFHQPSQTRATSPTPPPDSAHLIQDLGYDSLALAEVVFFFEDLYQVTISNDDLRTLLTVADLRAYVRAKVSAA